jgi:hypothetical protein
MSTNQISTSERLARALEVLGDSQLTGLVEKARAGFYDEFKSPLPYPQMTLISELSKLGQFGMIKRVADGEFEATMEEAQAWADSPEGQAALVGQLNRKIEVDCV